MFSLFGRRLLCDVLVLQMFSRADAASRNQQHHQSPLTTTEFFAGKRSRSPEILCSSSRDQRLQAMTANANTFKRVQTHSPEIRCKCDMNVIPSHIVRRNGSKKIEKCVVWNRQKTRKVSAYLILPNVSYNLRVLVYESPYGSSDKTMFQVDDKYYDVRCSNVHDARSCKPRLVMETPTVGAVSEENNEFAIELPNWEWEEPIMFYIDTKHVQCEFCNVIRLLVKVVAYSDNLEESESIYKEILFALHTSEE